MGLSRGRVWGRVDKDWGNVDGELCGGRVLGDIRWQPGGELGEVGICRGAGS